MRRLMWLILLPLIASGPNVWGQTTIPQPLTYCGLTLDLAPEAQRKVEVLVSEILAGPRYYHQMVQRAYMYMPFIEEAFADAGVPDDLKYLAIQESSLRPSAVSSSNAVGFWQFKQPTAEEMGLHIDERIDERRHIFRASWAAANYLARINQDFDNWAYAVIAYNEGPTGAVAYTDPAYYSQTRMHLDGSTHIYLLKAIAHKLAYQTALDQAGHPEVYLAPYSTVGETQPELLAADHNLDLGTLLTHNPWMLSPRRLPQLERPFTYYVPVSPDQYRGHHQDPNKVTPQVEAAPLVEAITPLATTPEVAVESLEPAQTEPEQSPSYQLQPLATNSQSMVPRAVDPRQLNSSSYATFPIRADLDYGKTYALAEGNRALINLALRHDISLNRLMHWNGFTPSKQPQDGQIIYLTKLRKAAYHVVLPGESLADIALAHHTKVRRIQRKNRMDKDEQTIYIGQKLYLRPTKPKQEKMIVLVESWQPNEPASPLSTSAVSTEEVLPVKPVASPRPTPPTRPSREVASAGTLAQPAPLQPSEPVIQAAEDPRIWIRHVVSHGETLWKISQRYDTKVEIIKRSNAMGEDAIHPGQELQILVRTSVLDRLATTRD